MNQGKYIFAQLTDFSPHRVFGQLTSGDSMRDLMLSPEAHQPKFYNLGFGPSVTRRNLGKANEKRSYKIFEEFAFVLIEEAFFVRRAKDNMRFNRMCSKHVDKDKGVRYDQIGKPETYYPKKEYPDKLRRIKYYYCFAAINPQHFST